ncbi:MAG TPA: flippase [Phototrophicaceae bacterium]|nr:flippase [Phototrophicaceae bacterium]
MTNNLGLKQLAVDSAFNLGRQLGVIILGLLTSILLARGLGTNDRGVYAIVVLFPTTLATLFNFGIAPASVYWIAHGDHNLISSIQGSLIFSLVSSICCLAAGGLLIHFGHDLLFPYIPSDYLFLGLLFTPIILHRDNLLAIFQGIQNFKAYNLIGLVPQFVILVLAFILVWECKTGIYGAILATILGHFCSLAVALYLLWRKGLQLWPIQFTRQQARNLLFYGLRGQVSNIIQFLNYRIDVFLLNFFANKTEVGLYDTAVNLVERLWIVSGAVSTVMLPRIASLQNDHDKRKLTPLINRYVFWLSLFMAAVAYILAEWGIVLLYGTEFRPATSAFRLLLVGIIMGGISKIIANDIAGRGKPGINGALALFALIVNIVANLILIPVQSYSGAAIASSISYSILALTLMVVFCRLSKSPWHELLVPTKDDFRLWRRGIQWTFSKLL